MKKINNLIIILLLLFVTSQIFYRSEDIVFSISYSFDLWTNNIFPSLFPVFIISELLINYGFVELTSELFKPFMNKVFKCGKYSSFVFIMSIISGIPSNAKYINTLYKEKLINDSEATKILMFTHFSNPLFILSTVSIIFLNNKEVGLLILCSHYITNLIIGIIFRNYSKTSEKYERINIKKSINKCYLKSCKSKPLGYVLQISLINTINTLLLILGIITFFLMLTTIIDKNLNLDVYTQSILNGILEMTQGLKYISILQVPLKIKAILSTFIISFGGISAHCQVMSILSETNIKYFPYFISRILHAIISSFIVFLLFDFNY